MGTMEALSTILGAGASMMAVLIGVGVAIYTIGRFLARR